MSDTTVLNVKIDKQLKRQAQEVAKALGLPVSTLVTASLRDVVSRRSITISDEPWLKPEVEAELLKISAEAKKGVNVSPAFSSADESIAWLKQEVAKENKR
jgi:addiction module RelB/DinJ family antitoxin